MHRDHGSVLRDPESITLVSGATMAGSLVGGIVDDVWSVHTALYVGIAVMAVAAIWVYLSPIPGIEHIPDTERDSVSS